MKKSVVVLIVILLLLVLGMGGYLVYDKVLSKDEVKENPSVENNKKSSDNEEDIYNTLSNDEALKIGQQLWNYAYDTLWCKNFNYSSELTNLGDGHQGYEIINYDEVRNNFSNDFVYKDESGKTRSWEERFEQYVINGKVYDPSGCSRGSDMNYGETQLSVKSITSNTLIFNSLSTYCNDVMWNENNSCKDEKITKKVEEDFSLKLVDGNWKISNFYLPN